MSEPTPSQAPTPLLETARALFAKARAWLAKLSRPMRVLLASTTVASILLVGWLAMRSAHETYAPLFTQLDRDDAAALVAKLKELKVPYRLGAEGTTIEVPEAKVHELRLELAAAGLPRGGGVGFESFDKMRLGATEFEQRVLYRRALEGELSRTISTVAAVQSARVHLVLPERSVFVSKNEPASASVVLKLRAGREIGASEVSAIVHLCASAVPGLSPDRVALLTTEGATLPKPRPAGNPAMANGAGGEAEGSQAKVLESSLEERARAMLERVVGPGHVDVRVTADVDYAHVERVEDHFDPAKTALRSEEHSYDKAPGEEAAGGVPGAESNLPATAGANVAAEPKSIVGAIHESHTRNFEVDRVTEKRISNTGILKKLGVAVLIDGVNKTENGVTTVVPRSPEELAKLTLLVRSAVGIDDKRGDLVTVESVPFLLDAEVPPVMASEAPPLLTVGRALPLLKKYKWIAVGAGGFLLLLGAVALLRRKRRKAKDVELKLLTAGPLETTPVLPPAHELPVLTAATVPENVREEAQERAMRDPATAALVLKHWLGSFDGVGTTPPAATEEPRATA